MAPKLKGLKLAIAPGSAAVGGVAIGAAPIDPFAGVPEADMKFRDKDFEFLCELGSGSGGSVSKVRHKATGAVMARKVGATSNKRDDICIFVWLWLVCSCISYPIERDLEFEDWIRSSFSRHYKHHCLLFFNLLSWIYFALSTYHSFRLPKPFLSHLLLFYRTSLFLLIVKLIGKRQRSRSRQS